MVNDDVRDGNGTTYLSLYEYATKLTLPDKSVKGTMPDVQTGGEVECLAGSYMMGLVQTGRAGLHGHEPNAAAVLFQVKHEEQMEDGHK